jgi:hypothetical protein
MLKTGKELKINDFQNYNIIYGSVNDKQPKAVYINLSAWSEPKSNSQIKYDKIIKDLRKKIKQSLYNYFVYNDYLDFDKDRTIVDLDIRESGIRFGKRSFMNCEITLFLNSEISINSEYIRLKLNDVINMVIDTALDDNKIFKFHKKKK